MFWRPTVPALVWALIILILCGVPGEKLPELSFLQWLKPDKIAHIVMFGVQSFLLMRGFERQTKFPFLARNVVSTSIIISIVFGCVVEVLQDHLFIQRSGDVRDAIANSLGAFTGWWFYRKKLKLKSLFG